MKAVFNASPLISLKTLDFLSLLCEFFEEVIIPEEVLNEVSVRDDEEEFIHQLKNQIPCLKVKGILSGNLKKILLQKIDYGESAVIINALKRKNCIVILDDKEARKTAHGLGLKVVGTAGILLSMKKKGLIESVKKSLEIIEEEIKFRLDTHLKDKILREAAELD